MSVEVKRFWDNKINSWPGESFSYVTKLFPSVLKWTQDLFATLMIFLLNVMQSTFISRDAERTFKIPYNNE